MWLLFTEVFCTCIDAVLMLFIIYALKKQCDAIAVSNPIHILKRC